MVRDRPEELGQVPDHFFWLRQGLQAAQDPVDGELVFITDQGRIAGRAALPSGFVIDRVVLDRTQVRLLDKTGRRQVSVARNIDASSVKSLQALPVMANREREIEVTRRGPRQLILRDRRRGGARPLDVRAITAGTLAQAREIGAGTASSRYVVSEEIVATVPSLQVRVFVSRFDRAGKLTGIAYIPIEGIEVVPHDFITVDDRGVVRALLPTAGGVKIREYEFSRPPRRRNGASEVQIKSLGRAIHEFAVQTNVQGGNNGQRTFRKGGVRFEVKPPAPSISREQVVKNAKAYLTVDWVMARENFSNPAVENLCSPQGSEVLAEALSISHRHLSARRSDRCLTAGAETTRPRLSRRVSKLARSRATSARAEVLPWITVWCRDRPASTAPVLFRAPGASASAARRGCSMSRPS